MTDQIAALARSLTETDLSTNDLLDWCDDESVLLTLDLVPDRSDPESRYEVMLRRRKGRIRQTLGWGLGDTAAEAISQAVVHAFARDDLCPRCFGYGRWPSDGGDCGQCGGTGLAP